MWTSPDHRDMLPQVHRSNYDAEPKPRNERFSRGSINTGMSDRRNSTMQNNRISNIDRVSHERKLNPKNPLPNIEINLVSEDKNCKSENSLYENDSNVGSRRAIKEEPSVNNLFNPIAYSTTLLPILTVNTLEHNRRTSMALLQKKVSQYHSYPTGGRRKTVHDKIKSWMCPSQTPANLKIFGGARAVQEEQTRALKAGWVIHPYSDLRYYWDLLIMVLLGINMVVLPLNIAFLETTDAWMVFEVIMLILFMVDVILNFRTGFKEDNKGYRLSIILNSKMIVKRYAKSWLIIDVVSSLPLDIITVAFTGSESSSDLGLGVKSASNALKFLRLTKLLSLFKLLRMSRFLRIVSKYEEFYRLTASIVRYIKLVLCMLLVAHWNGCLAFLLPLLEEFPPKCWVALNRLTDAHWTEQYGWALFKALSHMLCIGYGRFIPQLLSEALLTIFSMITGATFYALFIAHSMAYLQQNDSARRQFQEKFKQIEEYMCYRDLPLATRERITDYYEHKYTQKRLFNEQQILAEISPPLRNDIINHNCRDLVEKVPFLKEGGNDFITMIINNLEFDVYLPGDIVLKEGAFGNEMFFIRYGIVDVFTEDSVVATLTEGDYFGEITMLTGARRVASVRAITVCNLFILHKDNLYSALDEFPDMRVLLEHIALDRLLKLRTKHPESVCENNAMAASDLEASIEDRQLQEDEYDEFERRGTITSNASYDRRGTNDSTGTTIYISEAINQGLDRPMAQQQACTHLKSCLKQGSKVSFLPETVSPPPRPKPLRNQLTPVYQHHVQQRRHSHEPPRVSNPIPREVRSMSLNFGSSCNRENAPCECDMCSRDILT